MRNNKGFTLIELLAVISILSIIMSISIFFLSGALESAKEKKYMITLENIQREANSYVIENNEEFFFVSNNGTNTEYVCITVQNLIDKGYLHNEIVKSEVAEGEMVDPNKYIYIERKKDTKAITKSVYLNNSSSLDGSCQFSIRANGDIEFISNPGFDVWSKSKEITINYKIRNYDDITDKNKFDYRYSYSPAAGATLKTNNGNIKVLKVTKNGSLGAEIKDRDNGIANKTINISKIDTISPTIIANYSGDNTVSESVTISLKAYDLDDTNKECTNYDKCSGVDYSSFTKDDLVISIGGNTLSSNNYNLVNKGNGNYELTITNNNYDGTLSVKAKRDAISDNAGNKNNEISFNNLNISFKSTYTITYINNGFSYPIYSNINNNELFSLPYEQECSAVNCKIVDKKYVVVADEMDDNTVCTVDIYYLKWTDGTNTYEPQQSIVLNNDITLYPIYPDYTTYIRTNSTGKCGGGSGGGTGGDNPSPTNYCFCCSGSGKCEWASSPPGNNCQRAGDSKCENNTGGGGGSGGDNPPPTNVCFFCPSRNEYVWASTPPDGCPDTTTRTESECNKCKDGFHYNSSGTCVEDSSGGGNGNTPSEYKCYVCNHKYVWDDGSNTSSSTCGYINKSRNACNGCEKGYTGTNCTECAEGYKKDGNTCRSCNYTCSAGTYNATTKKCDPPLGEKYTIEQSYWQCCQSDYCRDAACDYSPRPSGYEDCNACNNKTHYNTHCVSEGYWWQSSYNGYTTQCAPGYDQNSLGDLSIVSGACNGNTAFSALSCEWSWPDPMCK